MQEDFVMFDSQSETSSRMYDARARNYDQSWHPPFARKVVELASPRLGDRVIDLACGTGLATVPSIEAVGPSGYVLGVDISPLMLAEAQSKVLDLEQSPGSRLPTVKLVRHDICLLDALPELEGQEGTFDVIILASALVLLENPRAALTQWAKFLKPGSGKLVADVPHPRNIRAGAIFELALKKCGLPTPYSRAWMTGEQAWRDMLESVTDESGGRMLEIDIMSFQQQEWFGRRYLPVGDGGKIFNATFDIPAFEAIHGIPESSKAELKSTFLELWREAAGPDGVEEVDGVWVAVTHRR